MGTLVSDGTGLGCEELLGPGGPVLGWGSEVSLPPSLLHNLPAEKCILPSEQSQTWAVQSGSRSSGISAFGTHV